MKKADPLVGSIVAGKFKVLSLVAAGGWGRCIAPSRCHSGRIVALKVLHVRRRATEVDSDDPQFKKRFLREASILAKLQHPNIVTIFDYGAIEGETERYFMAMEFLSGQTLGRRIADNTVLTPRDTIKIARQIARGLTEAHASGIIHRDLKPSNVMLLVGRDGEDLAEDRRLRHREVDRRRLARRGRAHAGGIVHRVAEVHGARADHARRKG